MEKENQISANMLVPRQGCNSCPVKKAAKRAGVEFIVDKRTCDKHQKHLCANIVEKTFIPHIEEFVIPFESKLERLIKSFTFRSPH